MLIKVYIYSSKIKKIGIVSKIIFFTNFKNIILNYIARTRKPKLLLFNNKNTLFKLFLCGPNNKIPGEYNIIIYY